MQRLRRDGLPHHRLAARAAHRHADQQPRAVQWAVSAAHHAHKRVFRPRDGASRLARRGALPAPCVNICGGHDARGVAAAVRHAAAGRKFLVLSGTAALPPSADQAGAGALASRPDGVRSRPRGDGRRPCGAAHLSVGKYHRGRRGAARARRGGTRPAGARAGTG